MSMDKEAKEELVALLRARVDMHRVNKQDAADRQETGVNRRTLRDLQDDFQESFHYLVEASAILKMVEEL